MISFFKKKKTYEDMEYIRKVEELIEKYAKGMTSFAYSYLKDWSQAEEVVQEVFIVVFNKLHTFRNQSNIKTWLYSITSNKCKDFLKSSYKKKVILSNDIQLFFHDSVSSSEDIFFNQINLKRISEATLALPIMYRETLILYYYEGLTTQEIAELLNINHATIRSRLQRARKILRTSLEGEFSYE